MYLWMKAMHIISLIAWYAGIFYIWRLFVYHSMTESDDVRKTLEIMEKKLMRYIMMPAAVSTIFFGLILLMIQWHSISGTYWFWIKLVLVTLVLAQHFLAGYYRKKLAAGVKYNHVIFRYWNEFPTVLLIVIVILAVVKPI
jgi:protoporphyrinogen IX oxidase